MLSDQNNTSSLKKKKSCCSNKISDNQKSQLRTDSTLIVNGFLQDQMMFTNVKVEMTVNCRKKPHLENPLKSIFKI